MTDEDEDYNSSDESSIAEELTSGNGGVSLKGQAGQGSKPTFGVLTLEDNEDDVEAFQRPDVADMYDDVGEGEDDEEEFAGEVEDIEMMDDMEKQPAFKKVVRKQVANSKNKALANSNAKASNTTNQSNRSDLDDSKKNKKKKR